MIRLRMFICNRPIPVVLAVSAAILTIGLALGARSTRPISTAAANVGQISEHPLSLVGLRNAETDRLTGEAAEQVNLHGSTAWVRALNLSAVQRVETRRLTGLAGEYFNLHGSTNWVRAQELIHAQPVDAARYTGLAIAYVEPPGHLIADGPDRQSLAVAGAVLAEIGSLTGKRLMSDSGSLAPTSDLTAGYVNPDRLAAILGRKASRLIDGR
jgi:hypothetical protein